MARKLAELLLRRKELQQKVDQLRSIKDKDLYEVQTQRRKAHENVDDIVMAVPRLQASQVTAEYDFYAKSLRLVDASIQQANWATDVTIDEDSLRAWNETEAFRKYETDMAARLSAAKEVKRAQAVE